LRVLTKGFMIYESSGLRVYEEAVYELSGRGREDMRVCLHGNH
jgi:hypothetical protein